MCFNPEMGWDLLPIFTQEIPSQNEINNFLWVAHKYNHTTPPKLLCQQIGRREPTNFSTSCTASRVAPRSSWLGASARSATAASYFLVEVLLRLPTLPPAPSSAVLPKLLPLYFSCQTIGTTLTLSLFPPISPCFGREKKLFRSSEDRLVFLAKRRGAGNPMLRDQELWEWTQGAMHPGT